jgi:hypothetical protein
LLDLILANGFKTCNSLKSIVDNFIAHAGDGDIRDKKGLYGKNIAVTLDKIAECHREICQAFNFISGQLLEVSESNYCLMPSTSGSPSKNMDKAMVLADDLVKLDRFWINHTEIGDTWNQKVISGEWLNHLSAVR